MNSRGALLSTHINIEIPFHDCDPMNIVWHGIYARYLEVARCELLRLFDYDYIQMKESGYAWPIVEMKTKYVSPAMFTQKIRVDAYLKEYETRLRIDYVISDSESGKKLTKATTVQVAVDIDTHSLQYVSPAVLIEKLSRIL